MYGEKMNSLLNDLENKDVEIAGGSVVGIVLSTVNSLIIYISNLTINKKKYEDVQNIVQQILFKAEKLKLESLKSIDEDKRILEKILEAYKTKTNYQEICKQATEFGIEVLKIAYNTYELTRQICNVGNRMLVSDFKICRYYSFASVQAAIENIEINVKSIEDEAYKNYIRKKYNEILTKVKMEEAID